MSDPRTKVTQSRRWVIKIGSTLLTDHGNGLNLNSLKAWVAQIMQLRRREINVVLVSSGAVAEGMSRLGWKEKPHALYKLQAAAAVGQMGLIKAYENCFQRYGAHTAQVLLTHGDIADQERYLNARSTLRELIDLGVIPVVNENDTVATEEICFSDNDTLAGMVVNLIGADLLVMLTDQLGLYNKNPLKNDDAELIAEARAGDLELLNYAGGSSSLGRGGMRTKVKAASSAGKCGANTIIASGLEESVLIRIANGEKIGTLFSTPLLPVAARRQWLVNHAHTSGWLTLSERAVANLRDRCINLLPADITAVEGEFSRGEAVSCIDQQGHEIARGLINYDADETQKIMGQASSSIETVLGYVDEAELIHFDNMVLNKK